MRLVVDMNLSPRWVGWLSEAGLDAEHWSTIGEATATDAVIMQTAQQRGAVVLTNDLDFGAMLASSGALVTLEPARSRVRVLPLTTE